MLLYRQNKSYPMNNLVNLSEIAEQFKQKGVSYTISSRGIRKDIDILDYLKIFFMYVPFKQIESVFGFVTDFSPLYGGRGFSKTFGMTQTHVNTLENKGIHISLTLTNHNFDEESYNSSIELLERHHKKGNSIVCVNDELARRIRIDFPHYEIKASLIKNLNTYEKVIKALELYDSVVIPMEMNDDDLFLESLPSKERIILFANAGCAYTCSARICYNTISHDIQGTTTSNMHGCSKDILPREDFGHVFFNIKKLTEMGFFRFKLIPNLKDSALQSARKLSNSRNYYLKTIKSNKPIFLLYSYPKSGRTWLRYMVANYLNLMYKLDLDLDLHSMFTLLPNYENDPIKGINAYAFADNDNFPALFSTHTPPNLLNMDSYPIILLLRLVYDVVVSDYFQHVYLLNRFEGSIGEFIREDKGSLDSYCHYLNEWGELLKTKNRNNLLLLTYEMIHSDTSKVLELVITFLGITLQKDLIQQSVEASVFDKMKLIEETKGLAGHEQAQENKEGRRVREGKRGNYRKYLSEEDIKYIYERCEIILTNDAKTLLEEYGISYKAV